MTGVSMERRHFQFIADTIADFEPPFCDCNEFSEDDIEQTMATRRALANHFVRELRHTNPNFNEDKFMRACLGNE